MKRIALVGILAIILACGIVGLSERKETSDKEIKSPPNEVGPRPLDKYTIDNLSQTEIEAGEIKIKEVLKEEDFTSYLFTFTFNPNLDGETLKQTTGQINIPTGDGPFPLIVMLRGYIDQERYRTGDGTRRTAEVFAQAGFMTVSPDFLGYAGSDKEAENIFEARFQTYVTILSLLKTLEESQSQPELITSSNNLTIEPFSHLAIFLWGHSNGGQIALTVLEATGKNYPTTLWAPVSKPFPYSVLYYTDEAQDRGKLIRRELAKFEELYNPDLYSIDIYFNRINSPLQIHQGTADTAVPASWSDELVDALEKLEAKVTYFKYPGANHNMLPSWNTVVARDLEFFNSHLKNN